MKITRFLIQIGLLSAIVVLYLMQSNITYAGYGFESAAKFRRPLNTLLNPVFSSYYDSNTTGSVTDYKCGSNTYNNHKGTDFRASVGTDVYSAAYGGVYSTYNNCNTYGSWGNLCGGGFGNHTKIDHEGNLMDGQGLRTVYAHLQLNKVVKYDGMNVNCGTYLGKTGSSGWSTGPHFHFEVQKYPYPQNDPFAGCKSGAIQYWTKVVNGVPDTLCAF